MVIAAVDAGVPRKGEAETSRRTRLVDAPAPGGDALGRPARDVRPLVAGREREREMYAGAPFAVARAAVADRRVLSGRGDIGPGNVG